MKRTDAVKDEDFDTLLSHSDAAFRNTIQSSIIKVKLLTHQCQSNCYQNNSKINEAENCARTCFQPLLQIKKNVTKLMDVQKEKLMKCKTDNFLRKEESANFYNLAIKKCFMAYSKNLEEIKEEIEFIYDGYTKNFESLIPNCKQSMPKNL